MKIQAAAAPLCNPVGPPYSPKEVGEILGLRDYHATLQTWRRTGVSPPFMRLGLKGARLYYPREAFWQWIESRSATTEEAG